MSKGLDQRVVSSPPIQLARIQKFELKLVKAKRTRANILPREKGLSLGRWCNQLDRKVIYSLNFQSNVMMRQ
jgi:hypothetical protein